MGKPKAATPKAAPKAAAPSPVVAAAAVAEVKNSRRSKAFTNFNEDEGKIISSMASKPIIIRCIKNGIQLFWKIMYSIV